MERDYLQKNEVTGHGWKGLKLKESRFRLYIRKKLFTMRVVMYRNRLPKDTVDGPSLEMFRARLEGIQSNLI